MAAIRRSRVFVTGALIGGGFYFLAIDNTSLPELYVLAGVSVACGATVLLAREQGFVEALVLPWWLLRGWRLLYKIPQDVGTVCWEALVQLVAPQPVRGEFRARRFDVGEPSPTELGRRALVEALGSLAPNTIVIGIDDQRGLLLVHQLRRQGSAQDLDVTRTG
ncbi:MAG: hypothetical protein WAL22_19820 [Solirubrobacteraceae bacterium]